MKVRRRHVEDDHQKSLIQWADMAVIGGRRIGPYLFHPSNGGKRNLMEACRLKAQGVRAGVSDLVLAIPVSPYHGLFLELKRPKTLTSRAGTLSDEQRDFLVLMAGVGYAVAVCYGWEDAKDTIEDYLAGYHVNEDYAKRTTHRR